MSDPVFCYYVCEECDEVYQKQWFERPWFGDYSAPCPMCEDRGKHVLNWPEVMHDSIVGASPDFSE